MKITGDEISENVGQIFTSFERQRHFQNIITIFRFGDMTYYWGLQSPNLIEKLPMICVCPVTQENPELYNVRKKIEDIRKDKLWNSMRKDILSDLSY